MNNTGVKTMSDRVSYKEMVELYNQGFNRLEAKIDFLSRQITEVNDKVEAVHIQATKTNGRVNACEDKEREIYKIIDDIKQQNKEQDAKIIKYGIIIGIIVTVISLTTGYVIPFI